MRSSRYECYPCGETFDTPAALRDHELAEHGARESPREEPPAP